MRLAMRLAIPDISTLLEQMQNSRPTKSNTPMQNYQIRITEVVTYQIHQKKIPQSRPTGSTDLLDLGGPFGPGGRPASRLSTASATTATSLGWVRFVIREKPKERANLKNQSSDKAVLKGSRETCQDLPFANRASVRETTRDMSYIRGNPLGLLEIMTLY